MILFDEKVGIQAGLADDGFQGSGFHLLVQRHRDRTGQTAIALLLHHRMTPAGADAAESGLEENRAYFLSRENAELRHKRLPNYGFSRPDGNAG